MAWNEQWSFKIDGVELNDRTNYVTYIPEIDNGFSGDVILVQVAGDVPWYVRVQPREGKFTVLLNMSACTPSVYATRLATLKGLFSPGEHSLAVQARGMDAVKTYSVIADGGFAIDYQQRKVTTTLTVLQQV